MSLSGWALGSPLFPSADVFVKHALLGLPLGGVCVAFVWGGHVSRLQGVVLVVLYVAYVALIWVLEGGPPAIGEVGELEEARERQTKVTTRRPGRSFGIVLAGIVAMAGGSLLLVEGVRRVVHAQDTQMTVSLTVVGFATAFELVVLAWSASRRGASETVVAAVVGSFAYNATMTLGAAAIVRPLVISDAGPLQVPALIMVGSLALVLALAWTSGQLGRRHATILIGCYPPFILAGVFLG